jgi:hypothetical protein
MIRPAGTSLVALLLAAVAASGMPARAAEVVYPAADGTLADGGGHGNRDGVADAANWELSSTGFAGAVTLATESPASAVEHRMVFEYDLRGLSIAAPLDAELIFTTRGVSVTPFPDVVLRVYSYPADLVESMSDFAAGPAAVAGEVTVTAMQPPTVVTVDVSAAVASAIAGGRGMVGLRFQIDPGTPNTVNQVFIDALGAAALSKPHLVIRSAVPADADNDGDADLADFEVFTDCLAGPDALPAPVASGLSASDCLHYFDRDDDDDVDLDDLSLLLGVFALD